MRELEELKRAIEQSDRLLSRVRELEQQSGQINEEKNELLAKYQAVSLRCSFSFIFPFLFS